MRPLFNFKTEIIMRKSDSLFGGGIPKMENDRLVMRRLAALSYVEDDSSDSSGSGAALASISAAAATLGSAYILSQSPNNSVNVPTRTIPAYGANTTGGGSMLLVVVAVIVIGVGALFFAMKG
jgi:hypothetical protein